MKKTLVTFDVETLRKDILTEAKVLNLPSNTIRPIADKVAAQVAVWMAKRPAVTVDDLNRRIAMEIAKYNADLAYVYQNRGKII